MPEPGRPPEAALAALRGVLAGFERVVVAFSGGADSGLLAYVATEVLGPERCEAVTAVSPSLAVAEHDDCRRLAAEWGLRWRPVPTAELDDPRYVANGRDRCYWCKSALLDALEPLPPGTTVLLGVNLDDLADHRPGQGAAAERGARFPLVEAGLAKADVRACSRLLGLRTWDKPAAPCLASRLPYGTPVTVGRLSRVERAESALRRLGLAELRVRHHGDTARLEVPLASFPLVVERRADVVRAVLAAGYARCTLDLEGLRSGSFDSVPP